MKILYVSGGSAGHLAPLVAVERAVKIMHPEAESLFLCSDRPEDALYLKHENVQFAALPRPRRSFSLPVAFLRNFLLSKKTIRSYKPDILFSKGGAVSVPACLAARMAGVPIVLHESDAVMGRANAIVARWADEVCMGFPTEERHKTQDTRHKNVSSHQSSATNKKKEEHGSNPYSLSSIPSTFTGNPIRPEVTEGSKTEGLRITQLSGTRPILLILGGSQGAEALNTAVRNHIQELLPVCDVIHLTGKGKKGADAHEGYWTTEFAYEELPHLYAVASFALSRAGAGSIGELAANGIPAILVPIKGLANDHQVKNAEIAAGHGGCTLLLQQDLEEKLVPAVFSLAKTPDTLNKMSEKMRTFQQSDAARRVAQILSQCIAQRRDPH